MTAHHSTSRSPRRAAGTALLAAALTFLAGCANDPPAGHAERIEKAAGVAAFKIACTRDLWERTSHPEYGEDSFDGAEPRELGGGPGERGLVEVTLTGTQLVDYLEALEQDVSDGPFANSDDQPMARRMYAALAPVVDRIERDGPPAEIPRAVVDDAAVPAGPSPSPSHAASGNR
ncbi:hypothetical protein ACFXKS_34965 [Streptomyces scopuliridis]|uniref:hypothetical protein n=1 Tax=Streptomyces scopuliridis TaxID=452529 RepID=UPI0036C17041